MVGIHHFHSEQYRSMKAQNLATFASGCFWCTEAIFQNLKGVERVISGYTGGDIPNPTYEQVCSGSTNHAEAVQITFDPNVISYEQLLDVFFHTHNPTTLNRQGNDVGTQYRSSIFYHSEEQREAAEKMKQKFNEAQEFDNPIVTGIVPFSAFYPVEQYHQNYYKENSSKPYCQIVISPKLKHFRERYAELLKK